MHKIEVHQFTGNNAIATEQGQALYDTVAPLIKSGHIIMLDFTGVAIYVSNFMASSLGQLAMDFDREELNTQIHVEGMNPIGKRLLRETIKLVRQQQTSD